MKARDHHSDPVFVSEWSVVEAPRKIELRIGESKPGESRFAVLTPREAQRIAIALLTLAEVSVPV